MKLIDKLLGRHNKEDYYFALYNHTNAGIVSLLVKVGVNRYYDVRNNDYIDENWQIRYKENLTNYIDVEKEMITEKEAKKLALPHYDKFCENLNKDIPMPRVYSGKGMEIEC